MPISDWNLEASEELGMMHALQVEARICSKNCNADMAHKGLCNRYCSNNICVVKI